MFNLIYIGLAILIAAFPPFGVAFFTLAAIVIYCAKIRTERAEQRQHLEWINSLPDRSVLRD